MVLSISALALALGATLAPAPAVATATLCTPSVISYEAGSRAPTLDAALVRSVGPEALLRSIGQLPAGELGAFVAGNEETVRGLIVAPPSARAVETWWGALSGSDHAALVAEAPELVGNLDGIPYEARDRANRAELAATRRELQARLTSGAIGKGAAWTVIDRLKMLDQIEESLDRTDGGPERRLIMLDTRMPGRAAVALGDLEQADYVSVLVPGALLSVREHMAEWTKVTADIYDEQLNWGDRFDEDFTVATVSWIGYRTPDVTNVAGLDLAEEGASFLSSTVNGLKALRDGDKPHVSVFAHSYGATAAVLALERGDMSVDALAMVGSPGGVAETADQLAVPSGNVWVGEAAWDPVVHTAFFGADPGSPEFGAKSMSVAGAVDPVTGDVLTASVGHDWYLEPGTESLRNLSLIGIDQGGRVTDGTHADSGTMMAAAG